MSANSIEKNALKLSQLLRDYGKVIDKERRKRTRALLAQTFEAMNARPLNGTLCKQLSDQIEVELEQFQSLSEQPSEEQNEDVPKQKRKKNKSENAQRLAKALELTTPVAPKTVETTAPVEQRAPENSSEIDQSAHVVSAHVSLSPDGEDSAPVDAAATTPDARTAQDVDVATETSPDAQPKDNSPGLFDLIHVQIRCFIKIRAVQKPPYIGRFVMFSEKFADALETRIDKFINVLSNHSEDIGEKLQVERGYVDDLLPDMPDFNLILHPKRKKR